MPRTPNCCTSWMVTSRTAARPEKRHSGFLRGPQPADRDQDQRGRLDEAAGGARLTWRAINRDLSGASSQSGFRVRYRVAEVIRLAPLLAHACWQRRPCSPRTLSQDSLRPAGSRQGTSARESSIVDQKQIWTSPFRIKRRTRNGG